MNEKDLEFLLACKRDVFAIQLLEVAAILIEPIREYAKENGIKSTDCGKLKMLMCKVKRLIGNLNALDSK